MFFVRRKGSIVTYVIVIAKGIVLNLFVIPFLILWRMGIIGTPFAKWEASVYEF